MNAPTLVPKFMFDKQREKNKVLQDSHERLFIILEQVSKAVNWNESTDLASEIFKANRYAITLAKNLQGGK